MDQMSKKIYQSETDMWLLIQGNYFHQEQQVLILFGLGTKEKTFFEPLKRLKFTDCLRILLLVLVYCNVSFNPLIALPGSHRQLKNDNKSAPAAGQ